ncbi:hypothetical protein BDR05DRAFT_957352 [Suillus weaverae]|nr:hypothetical protein BDR05DRAFT_957352 [Suillus weaverae]
MHVSPVELIIYVSVVGVSGGRTWDECILRAWVVLSHAAATLGEREVVAQLDAWVQEQLRGGALIPKSPTGKVLRWVLVEQFDREAKAKL